MIPYVCDEQNCGVFYRKHFKVVLLWGRGGTLIGLLYENALNIMLTNYSFRFKFFVR
jgi:hypothetical protein